MLKAPFPYFGGKSRAAELVWIRFGDVPNYVDPFCGSLAVLLARPHEPKIETVNDADALLANFWRAVQVEPDAVAEWADWPVNENDLHARHLWLVTTGRARVERLTINPDYYDAKAAGWWVWGISQWIGSGWCAGGGGEAVSGEPGGAGNPGMGVHRQLPHLGDAGRGDALIGYMRALQDRLRRVRVCCGDWTRVLGPSPTTHLGLTGVLLDPPYAHNERQTGLYAKDTDVSAAVRAWAIEHGDDPLLRIALCGYEGEHIMPDTWEAVPWKAHGGYGSQGTGRGRANAERERIWFSPACIRPDGLRQMEMF